MSISLDRHQFSEMLAQSERIKYKRDGGFFITKCVCFMFAVISLISSIIVGLAVYYIMSDQETISEKQIWNMNEPENTDVQALHITRDVVPEYYRLKILPYFNTSTFHGHVHITVLCNRGDIKEIVLNAKNLTIDKKGIKVTEQIIEKIHSLQKRSKRDTTATNDTALNSSSVDNINTSLNVSVRNQNGSIISNNITNNETHSVIEPVIVETKNLQPVENKTLSDSSEIKNKNDSVKTEIENVTSTNIPIIEKAIITNNLSDTTEKAKESYEPVTISMKTQSKTTEKQVTHSNAKDIPISKVIIDDKTERITIVTLKALKKNVKYVIEIPFSGNLSETSIGFFKDFYNVTSQAYHPLAATQFEPTFARRAFPCFDEPDLKASFEISIARPGNMTALSNMPLSSEETFATDPSWKWSHFQKSIKMSTYVVAFAIIDYDSLKTTYTNIINKTIDLNIWTRKAVLNDGNYALGLATKLLKYYENTFNIPFNLDKIDIVTIPNFEQEAMENWGLITFRENDLLYNNENVKSKKMTVALTLAHELAHQWFGNLVTMRWWTDIWLNEGFATFMQYAAINQITPEWKVTQFLVERKMDLMKIDALPDTTPLSVVVDDPSKISQKFDDISYTKGATILRMLNYTLGKDLFYKGLTNYLNKWKFQNADEEDLWSSISQEASSNTLFKGNITLVDYMKSWTRQAGFPVVTVQRNDKAGSLRFAQEIFSAFDEKNNDRTWIIPLTYMKFNINDHKWGNMSTVWMSGRSKNISTLLSDETIIYANIENIGYYRVNYDEENWHMLIQLLRQRSTSIPEVTRAQLVDDALNLAKLSKLKYDIALNITTYYRKGETSPIVWNALLSNLYYFNMLLKDSVYYRDFQYYTLKLIEHELKKLEYGNKPPSSDREQILMQVLVWWECEMESTRCIEWAKFMFNKWMNDSTQVIVSPHRTTILSTAIKFGGRSEYQFLWFMYKNTTVPSIKIDILQSLGNSRDEAVVYQMLEDSLTTMPFVDAKLLWSGLTSLVAKETAQRFLISNWMRIYNKFTKYDSLALQPIIDGAFNMISQDYQYERFLKFVKSNTNELKTIFIKVKQLNHAVKLKQEWISKHLNEVGTWLQEYTTMDSYKPASSIKTNLNKTTAVDQEVSSVGNHNNATVGTKD